MKDYYIGVDLGGTKIMTGVIDRGGKIISEPVKIPTGAENPPETIIERIAESIYNALKTSQISIESIRTIGIGSPGPLDIKKGMILEAPNLPTLRNFPLKAKIEEIFKKEVRINNDANCFVLAEALFGAGKGEAIVFGVTLGTGFGSGIVMNGKIYNGATGTAAEIWPCPYKDGRFEDYNSGKGVKAIYRSLTGEKLSPLKIQQKAREKSENALKTWREYGKDLGISLSYIVNVLDPGVIIIGGSISKAHEFFIDFLTQNLKENITKAPAENLKIKLAELGDYAGLIGAAALGF